MQKQAKEASMSRKQLQILDWTLALGAGVCVVLLVDLIFPYFVR